ncbi:secretion/DNA translocation related TadE-like protein [Rhodococcus sp. 27YEA15]|uniref:Rv3654c family TadE-like protein n=1 Tax=Rhodococcus sp. 27YEA15 TaxID=3156259 RepID=UPI003C79EDE8
MPWGEGGVLRGDGGSATVFSCFVLAVIVVVTGGVLHVGSAVVARHTAQASADLSALAGAGAVDAGDGAACARAEDIAVRMGTHIVDCTVEEWDVQVRVRASVLLSGFGVGDAVALARAGPSE